MSDKYPGNFITGPSSGYSVYFNGVNSYLTFTKNLELTTDFTIEFWLYPVAQSTAGFYFMGSVIGPYIATEALKMLVGQNGAWLINPALPMPSLNRWNHIALVRASNVMRLYINGVSSSPYTTTQSFTGSQTFGIGAENSGASIINKEFFMTSLRVSTIARYSGTSTTSANFGFPSLPLKTDVNTKFLSCQTPTIIDQSASPATITVNGAAAVSDFYLPSNNPGQFNPALGAAAPGIWSLDEAAYYTRNRLWPIYDPKFSNTTLMLHGNGVNNAQNNTFLDSSTNNFSIARTGNTTQGTFSPFSQTGWSVNFNRGTLTTTLTGKSAGTGSVTYELFFYSTLRDTAITSQSALFNSRGAGTGGDGIDCTVLSTGDIRITTSGSVLFQSASTIPSNDIWYHLAIVRNGTTNWTVYLNGTSIGTFSSSINLSSVNLYLGTVGGGTQDWLKGYISNFRYTRAAVYTSNFTPITTPLTVIANTEFLSCLTNQFKDISANNFTVTPAAVTGTLPSIQAYSPFSPAIAYTPEAVGGSGYFDGGSDYLTITGTAALVPDTVFTFEAWIYFGAIVSNEIIYSSTTTGQLLIGFNTTTSWGIGARAGAFLLTSTTLPIANQWNHIVACRGGTGTNQASLFLNGVRVANGTVSNAFNTTANYQVGYDGGSPTWTGLISGLRLVKSDVYGYTNTTITVPTAPPTAIANTALLINFTNAGILDSTGKNNLETAADAKISTAQSKFGGSSMVFDGTGDYLLAASSTNFDLAAGDFTVEFWVQPTTITGSERGIFGIGTTDPNSNLIRIQASTSKLQFWLGGSNSGGPGAGTKTGIITCTTALVLNAWYHVALVRSGSGTNNVKLYLNGVLDGQGTGTYNIGANPFSLGMGYPGSVTELFIGYIDDFRITKGVARYLANFTPPTSQLQDQ